ncbi:MAG TPA: preprotein translocase subunit SecG [Gemmatimonadaceae bacterium]|jgi:preprotein translocase subunit SecG|nr:preprotein translocase subunit SecG [Gemmatimonadaceae bacterium]
MLYGFLFTLLVLDAVVLGAAILMQSGKGGGMAASFGGASSSTDAVMGVRQAGNFLTATSWWAGGIFLALAFVLSMMSTRNRLPESVLDQPLQTTPAPVTGAPALPLETAPTTTTTPSTGAPATRTPAPRP